MNDANDKPPSLGNTLFLGGACIALGSMARLVPDDPGCERGMQRCSFGHRLHDQIIGVRAADVRTQLVMFNRSRTLC